MIIKMLDPYSLYLAFQSPGKLMPGCGHAGQNMAIDPLAPSSSLCPRPVCILFQRSCHCHEALRSCLYRFYDREHGHTSHHIERQLKHTGTVWGNIRLVMLWSFEKYCCAVVLHSRLSVKNSSRTEKVNTVSICLKLKGNIPDWRSCSSFCPALGQMQYNTSISKTPDWWTTVSSKFPKAAVLAHLIFSE